MKKIMYCLLLFFGFSYQASANIFTEVTSHGITLKYITYPVGSEIYKLHVSTSEDVTNIETLGKEKNALTGINGVFFCPADYRECKGKNYTINERFENGVDLSFYTDTGDRAVFWWDENMKPFLFQTSKDPASLRNDIYEGMGNFPILYRDGENMLEYYHDVGLYDAKMAGTMTRHYICSNKEKTEIFFWSSSAASLDDLAPALYDIGCWDGINLDAGNSTQFMYNGRRLEYSGRNVLDWFFIEHKDINTLELSKQIDTIMAQVETSYAKRYSQKTIIEKMDVFLAAIKKIRSDMYESYAVDIYDAENKNIWYTLEIDNIKDLKRVYMLNLLEARLKSYQTEMKVGLE